jgi:hypothetical protein
MLSIKQYENIFKQHLEIKIHQSQKVKPLRGFISKDY